jgi:hypothetical protein
LLNGQIAQALLRSEGEAMKPHLEIHQQKSILVLPDQVGEDHASYQSLFGDWKGATVLCACGALVRLDRTSVNRRRQMGKPLECQRCRNRRVSLEREDMNNEFYECEGE